MSNKDERILLRPFRKPTCVCIVNGTPVIDDGDRVFAVPKGETADDPDVQKAIDWLRDLQEYEP